MTKGIYPSAQLRLIPPGSNDPPINPRVAILHVAVSMAQSLYYFFRDRSGGIESHFYINWRGKIDQYRNIFWQADANHRANDFAVSIETAGFGPGWWNPLQKRAIKRLLLWLHEETDGAIPLEVCGSAYGAGVGYHTMWGSPSAWTPVAKSCPGPNRIKQFKRWLTPWLQSNPASEEIDMDEKQLRKMMREESTAAIKNVIDGPANRWGNKGRARFRGLTLRGLWHRTAIELGVDNRDVEEEDQPGES